MIMKKGFLLLLLCALTYSFEVMSKLVAAYEREVGAKLR